MRPHVVLIGPPGSGKGTQAGRLAKRYRIPHISTGDILRQAVRDRTPLGRKVGEIMARGALVDDTLMSELVRERLARPDAASGFILDGFPRTVHQARALDEIVRRAPLIVALIEVSAEAIVQRLSNRRVCKSCGMTQSVSDEDGQGESCPYCGGALIRREDDDPATVRHRLATYASSAEPVIAHYRAQPGFVAIDGLRPPDQVSTALAQAIDERRAANGA
jgi:adenylate kinase